MWHLKKILKAKQFSLKIIKTSKYLVDILEGQNMIETTENNTKWGP